MRISFLLPLLICLFCSTSLYSQQNEAAIDLRVAPGIGQLNYGASLNYFRSVSARRSVGGKVTIHTDPFEEEFEGVRHHLIVADCVNRWKLNKGDRVRFNVEMGISMLLDIKRTMPYTTTTRDCGVGLTEAQLDEIRHTYVNGKRENNLFWGPALGTSLDFRLSSKLSFGASAFCNWYFIPNEEIFYPYCSPALRTSFHF